jgi:hypothetical protein
MLKKVLGEQEKGILGSYSRQRQNVPPRDIEGTMRGRERWE